ncbi:MAG: PEP-CTERM sorting domain-containing protein [Planctomycetaceae bacterium]|nr:PEP-CTERM sorting domain-containing protein [Planctomycetaceae bacterium]
MRQRFLAACAFTVLAVVGSAVLAEGITPYGGSTAQGEIMAPTTLTMGGTMRIMPSYVTPSLTFSALDAQPLQIAPSSQSSATWDECTASYGCTTACGKTMLSGGTLRCTSSSIDYSTLKWTVVNPPKTNTIDWIIASGGTIRFSSGVIWDTTSVTANPSLSTLTFSGANPITVSTLSTGESISTPEPSSLLLLGAASAAFLWWRRRQKRLG